MILFKVITFLRRFVLNVVMVIDDSLLPGRQMEEENAIR